MRQRVRIVHGHGFEGGVQPLEPRTLLSSDAHIVMEFRREIDHNQTVHVDVNGDGHLDVVAAAFRQVGIALSDGLGGHLAPRYVGFNEPVIGFVIGDLDGDGDGDLAVLTGNRLVRVYDDGPSAYFTRRTLFDLGYRATSITAGQFNNDDVLDLAVMQPPVPGRPNNSSVRLIIQDSMGGLTPGLGRPVPVAGSLSSAQIRPGGTDEILLMAREPNEIHGAFATRTTVFAIGPERLKIIDEEVNLDIAPYAIADVNNDGLDDWVMVRSAGSGQVIVSIAIRDEQSESLYVDVLVGMFQGIVRSAGLHDLTGDNHPDIILIGRLPQFTTVGEHELGVYLLADDGAGGYLQPHQIGTIVPTIVDGRVQNTSIVGFSDSNGDGVADVIVRVESNSVVGSVTPGTGFAVLAIESPDPMDPSGSWITKTLYERVHPVLAFTHQYHVRLTPDLLGMGQDGLIIGRNLPFAIGDGTGVLLVCPVA
ncbi:MAG: VCBS repeat-containing protein [Phycisphaeraceae bacterium]|nr:VCBS repeat-containing protein [Phycisphaeraceae bacterium]